LSASRRRIMVFVPSTPAAISYLGTRAFAPLAEHHDLHLVCHSEVHLGDLDLRDFTDVTVLSPDVPHRSRLRVWMMYFGMWANRKVTRRFSNSFERVFTMNLAYASWWRLFKLYYLPAFFPPVARLLTRVMEWYAGRNVELQALIERVQPELIIGHGRGYDARDIDLTKAAQRAGVPIMSLQLNWDVFAHRGVLPALPDYVGVWGYQSSVWTEFIHALPKRRTFLVGAPFSDLLRAPHPDSREALMARLGLPAGNTVLLLAGCGRGVNETGILILLEAAIEAGVLKDCCVVYRPHPLRHRPRYEPNYFEQNFKHVFLDVTMAARYREAVGRNSAMSKRGEIPMDYRYVRELFSVVSAMIAPITTFMLEAAYFGIPSVEIAFVDEANEAQNNRFDLPMSSYFQGLPGVFVCTSPLVLVGKVLEALAFVGDPERLAVLRAHVRGAVYADGAEVKDRIADAVNRVLRGTAVSRFHHLTPWTERDW
jgi:hypothetical protein